MNPTESKTARTAMESSLPVRPFSPILMLLGILAFYAVFAGAVIRRSMDAIDIDGVSYILSATHYARGEWSLAISGSWSPMLAWLLVPAIRLGYDPIRFYRFLALFFGAGFVIGARVLASRLPMSPKFLNLAMFSTACMAAVFTGTQVTPDLLMAAILAFYFYLTLNPDLGKKPHQGFLCGVVAGLAYLAKAYAGPFFLAHFTVLIGWLGVSNKAGAHVHKLARTWLWGLVGFVLIAGPWIGVISTKYGHFTLSTATGSSRAIVAPGVERGRHPMGDGLWKIPPGRLNIWEDPALIPYQSWSPIASWPNFKHQIAETGRSALTILGIFWQVDFLKFGVLALAATIVLAFRRRENDAGRRVYRWIVLTIAIYCSGYLLVFAVDFRYYWPICLLLVLLVYHFADRLSRRFRSARSNLHPRFRQLLLAGFLVLPGFSFAVNPGRTFIDWRVDPPRGRVYRTIGSELAQRHVEGPIASTEWFGGFYLSYYLRQPYVGRPMELGPTLEDRLRSAGVRTLFVWGPAEEVGRLFAGRRAFQLVVQYKTIAHPGLTTDLAVYRVGPRE